MGIGASFPREHSIKIAENFEFNRQMTARIMLILLDYKSRSDSSIEVGIPIALIAMATKLLEHLAPGTLSAPFLSTPRPFMLFV